MRTNRTRDEWNSIFEAHARSGLTQNEFCRKRGITRSAFSNAKQRIGASSTRKSVFVPAFPPQSLTEEPVNADTGPTPLAESTSGSGTLLLRLPGATLCLSTDISPRWLATLLREMAP